MLALLPAAASADEKSLYRAELRSLKRIHRRRAGEDRGPGSKAHLEAARDRSPGYWTPEVHYSLAMRPDGHRNPFGRSTTPRPAGRDYISFRPRTEQEHRSHPEPTV